ncbi:MAG: LytTR family transcriptional regulator DNA-binding domain-containing protein [Clostridia bacterium]|nr:LytTR family transcriptional regulator DNA-binding domain-containing protein [Clostridia bacterium]
METKENKHIKTKEEIVEILNSNGLSHYSVTYHGCNGFFIPASDSESCRTYPGISVTMCNKDICRVYPHKIIYIAIEDRKSVLYLTDRKIETYCSMDYWKNVLDENSFAQPHYSYIVNLHYVEEVTKDFVTLKCGEYEYKVYTSMRKIGAFKKAVAEFERNAK